MQLLLDQFNQIAGHEDLFLFWEKEVDMRHLMRISDLDDSPLHLHEAEEIDFLYRSLFFFGQKSQFYALLFDNLQQMAILTWFNRSPEWFKTSFLAYLPWHIDNVKPHPSDLMGLIRIYHDEYQSGFLPIVNVFTLEACNYLLPRTANAGFRQMIQTRQKYLTTSKSEYTYGILKDNSKGLPYPTLFGDKLVLLRQAAELLQQSSPANFRDTYGVDRFKLLLQCAELMFRSGLLEDCLAFLLDSYEDYREKNHLVNMVEDMAIHKQFKKILRALIPMYAIVRHPLQAMEAATRIYRRDFSQISPDEGSLYYLDLFASINSGLHRHQSGIVYELVLKADTIKRYCPGEPELITAEEAVNGLSPERLKQLQLNYRQKMVSKPHEALAIMELVRLLAQLQLAELDHSQVNHLLHSYISLWKWVPAHCFLNTEIIGQLAPLAERHHRQELERIQPWLNDLAGERLRTELTVKPDLFRKKGEDIRRAILMAYFTGVM